MALPQLRSNGTLPSGQHYITDVGDLLTVFPAVTARRQTLQAALTLLIEVVRRLMLGTSLVIDGSYTTGKTDPDDIDIAMLSTGANETTTLQLLETEGVDLNLLDIFVSTTQPAFEGWVRFFSADRLGQARGVVILTI